ncbi:MAG: hypothetical protein HQL24_09890 [Candidatus Omnitrophica bacterium]|nr:hypothetical protein [Candidatus Omnitrophota bacterium]
MDKNFSEFSSLDSKAIIIELKIAHEAILKLLDQIQAVMHAYPKAKPFVRELQDLLLNHFERQNRKLIGFLQSVAMEHNDQSKDAHFLLQDLKDIKIKTWFFIDEHPADMGDVNPKNFIADFKDFSLCLSFRIKTERDRLIPLLESIFKNNS